MKDARKIIRDFDFRVTGSKWLLASCTSQKANIYRFFRSKHMDTHERIYPCLQPGCSKLEGFTSAGGLKRHEKQVHKMHGVVEYHCPHAGCSRAEGKGRPFTRKENRADHLRRQHNKHDNTPVKVNRPIAARPGVKEKGNSACNEVTQAPGENALLRATIEQLERRIEQLENARSG